jgi:hypothetical protein
MNLKNTFMLLLVTLLISGCGKKTRIYPVDGFAVSGRITYEKETPVVGIFGLTTDSEIAPVPCAYVEVLDTSDGNRVITYGATGDDGIFKIGLPLDMQNSPLMVRVYTVCGLDNFPMTVNNQPVGDVVSSTNAYFVNSDVFIGKKDDMEILVTKDSFSGTLAGAFNIYSQIIKGYKFVINSGGERGSFPSLKVNWEKGNDGIGCTCYVKQFIFQRTINLREDENDDSVILHEFGHYLQDVFSNTSSPGGMHIISCSQDDDPRLTWSEGWATGYALMVRKSSYYIDTDNQNFYVEHEFPCHIGQGSVSETVVAAMYLDLYDGTANGMPTEDNDTVSITFQQIWRAMKNVPSGSQLTVYDFYQALLDIGAITQQSWFDNFATLGLDETTMIANSSPQGIPGTCPSIPPQADPEFHVLVESP